METQRSIRLKRGISLVNEMDYMMEDKVENDRKSNYKRDMYAPLSPEDPVDGSLFVDQVLMRFGIDPN